MPLALRKRSKTCEVAPQSQWVLCYVKDPLPPLACSDEKRQLSLKELPLPGGCSMGAVFYKASLVGFSKGLLYGGRVAQTN